MSEGTPVVETYGIPYPYKFTGKINKVTIDVKPEKLSADDQKFIDQKLVDNDSSIE